MSKEAIERLVKLAMLYQDEGPGDHFRVDERTSYWDYLLELQHRYAHAQRVHDEYQKEHGINLSLILFKDAIDLLYVTEEPMRTDEHREEISREIEQLFASDEHRSLLPHDKAVAMIYASLKFREADYHDFVQHVRHLVPARLKELPHKPDFMTEIPRDLPAFVQLVRTIESEARVQLASIKVESKEDVEASLLYLFWLAREWQQREYWDNLRYTRLSLNSAYTELSAELRSAYFRVTSEIDQLCATTPRTLDNRRQSCDRICEVVSKSESGVRNAVEFYRELKLASVKLQDLELLVRQHVPEMLLHVPVIDDFVMEWDIDTFKVCNGMRAIECAALELARETARLATGNLSDAPSESGAVVQSTSVGDLVTQERRVGSTRTPLSATLQQCDKHGVPAPVNLADCDVYFQMIDLATDSVVVPWTTKGVTIDDSEAGEVSYRFTPESVSRAGLFACEFKAVYPDGTSEPFPVVPRGLLVAIHSDSMTAEQAHQKKVSETRTPAEAGESPIPQTSEPSGLSESEWSTPLPKREWLQRWNHSTKKDGVWNSRVKKGRNSTPAGAKLIDDDLWAFTRTFCLNNGFDTKGLIFTTES